LLSPDEYVLSGFCLFLTKLIMVIDANAIYIRRPTKADILKIKGIGPNVK